MFGRGVSDEKRKGRRMRTKYTIINMLVNVGGQMLNMLLQFISRMIFIRYLSAAYLGVNGLFTDVLGILNFAELGIGTAMIFSMYEPAANDDKDKIARLMNLYKWLYRGVAACVLAVGLILLPFLHFFIKDSSGIEHIRFIYMLYVLNSSCSYLLNYKNSIYLANQKAYIKSAYGQVTDCLRVIFQIVALVLTRNFILYLIIQFVMQFIPNIIISYKVDREFPYLKECHELPEKEERKGILRNIGAMSIHKAATVVVRNTDSLIMSSFIGLSAVGIYSNYKLVTNSINTFMAKLSSAMTGSIGNLGAIEDETRVYDVYRQLEFMFFILYSYWAGGLFTLFNAFIGLFFGWQFCFPMTTVGIIVAEFWITGMRQINLLFREAKGLFWYDRYKAVVESIINLVVSLILVQYYGIAGVIGGTIISSICTCVWIEPYILMRYGMRKEWKKRLKQYFAEYLCRVIIMFLLAAVSYGWVHYFPVDSVFRFILTGVLYTVLFAVTMYGLYGRSTEFKALKERFINIARKGLKK